MMKRNMVPIFTSVWIDNNENRFILFLVIILMITGCNYSKSLNSTNQNSSEKTDTLAVVTDLNITPEKLCFMSEIPWKDPSPEFKNAMDIILSPDHPVLEKGREVMQQAFKRNR